MSEKKVDKILLNIGVPQTVINEWEFPKKLKLAQKAKKNKKIKFVKHIEKDYYVNSEGQLEAVPKHSATGISTMSSTIPETDLTLSFDVVDLYTKYGVYGNFHWLTSVDLDGDRMGMAVNEDWNLIAGSYACHNYWKPLADSVWYDGGNCGGRPLTIDVYGADWNVENFPGENNVEAKRAKGYIYFEMSPSDPYAYRRVISQYCHDNTSGGTSSISVTIGPLSVSHTTSSGSISKAAEDTSF
ncbi:MAG TPA: hypothetical protein VFK44_09790 [Bacillales bacterium]|nr:hypothetical protein [Bacillales bacterium]